VNNSIHITVCFDRPELLENLVEVLVCRHTDMECSKEYVLQNWEAVESSSAETYVSGTVAQEDDHDNINMPFISSFLFTCTKKKNQRYQLTWGTSLS